MVNAKVLSTHYVDGKIIDKEKEFIDKEDALSYAKEMNCLIVRVLEKDVGVIYYNKPGLHGIEETV